MRTNLVVGILVAASLFALSGCMKEEEKEGTVGVLVTDAPTDDYSHVNVTFNMVEVHKSGEGNESGWLTVSEETRTVDFIALHNDNALASLGFGEVTAGNYQQIRLSITHAEAIQKSDGSVVPLTVPSGTLKTSKSFKVAEGGNTTITIEFDLNRSISCTNNGCRFSPVLGPVTVKEES